MQSLSCGSGNGVYKVENRKIPGSKRAWDGDLQLWKEQQILQYLIIIKLYCPTVKYHTKDNYEHQTKLSKMGIVKALDSINMLRVWKWEIETPSCGRDNRGCKV